MYLLALILIVSAGIQPEADRDSFFTALHGVSDGNFGPVDVFHRILTTEDAEARVMQLHLIEAGYSEYDIVQSRGRLEGKAQVAGVLVTGPEYVLLVGERVGKCTTLIDMASFIDRRAVSETLAQRQMSHSLNMLDSRSHGWDVLVEHLLADGGPHPLRLSEPVHIRSECGTLGIALSEEMLARLGPTASGEFELHEAPMENHERRTLFGEMHSDQRHDVRIVSIDVPVGDGRVAKAALLTMRFAERRLAGDLPADSPWPSRVAMIRALQDLEQAQLESGEPLQDHQVRSLIAQHLGAERTWAEFVDELIEVFGSFDSAVDAACPLAEVQHSAMLAVPGAGTCLQGVAWYEEKDEQGQRLVVPNRLEQVRLPSVVTLETEADLRVRWLQGPSLNPYTIEIRGVLAAP